MFVLFPIRTDRRHKRTPWLNYCLVLANVAVFIVTHQQIQKFSHQPLGLALQQAPVMRYLLWPDDLHLVQFFSYQFLHGDWMHLIGNMIFLWVFGNSVEDRFGKVGYLLFYLAGGVMAGLVHALFSNSPILGASGSIAAVTGAYLALFPLSNVTIFYWFIYMIGAFEITGMLLILFRVVQDAAFQLFNIGGVAYMAHLGGYCFGFIIGMALLLLRIAPREPYDMLALIEQKRRRAQFRKLTRSGFQPWEATRAGDQTSGEETPAETITPQQQKIMDLRTRVSAALGQHDLTDAARIYSELLKIDPNQTMGQQQQLDLANQLMSDGQYHTAATAYELFLQTYKAYPQKHHIQLILGLIYARYLEEKTRAKELLDEAVGRLDDTDRELAKTVLAELG